MFNYQALLSIVSICERACSLFYVGQSCRNLFFITEQVSAHPSEVQLNKHVHFLPKIRNVVRDELLDNWQTLAHISNILFHMNKTEYLINDESLFVKLIY